MHQENVILTQADKQCLTRRQEESCGKKNRNVLPEAQRTLKKEYPFLKKVPVIR